VEFFRAFFWFHPLAWWVRDQALLNLEYLADAAVLRAGYDKKAYHQQGVDFRTSLLPQFAAKGIKRRIKMMSFRAGSQVRSLVVTGGLIFCAFTAFAMTNGQSQPVSDGSSVEPIEINVSTLPEGDITEYNIYFRRLPTPGELDILKQPLNQFGPPSLLLYHDCIEPADVFSFVQNSGQNQIIGQTNLRPGEQLSNYYRYQFKIDGKGYSGSANFPPQSLPDDAPKADILMNIDGNWREVQSDDKQAFTPENLTAGPLQAQLNCQLRLTPENKDEYKTAVHTKNDLEVTNSSYALGSVDGLIMAMTTADTADPTSIDMSYSNNIPRRYFSGTEEIEQDDFLDLMMQDNQRLTVAVRTGGAEELAVVRLDPSANQ